MGAWENEYFIAEISTLQNMNTDIDDVRITPVFRGLDTDCVTDGNLVSLAYVSAVLDG